MKLRVVVDTTVFIDASGQNTELRATANRLLDAAFGGQIDARVSAETVQEVFSVFARRSGDRGTGLAMAKLIASSLTVEPISLKSLEASLGLLSKHGRIGGRDAFVLAALETSKSALLATRDLRLGEAAGDRWLDTRSADLVEGALAARR